MSDIEKIEQEICEGLEELSKLAVGTDEYDKVFKSVKALEELKEQKLMAEAKLELDDRKQDLAERRELAEVEGKEAEVKASRFQEKMGVVKTGLIVLGTLVGTVITVNAEKTQIISSKGIELFSKFKNTLR